MSAPIKGSGPRRQVGFLTEKIIMLGQLPDTWHPGPVWIGPSNISHMRRRHPDDFDRYFRLIPAILRHPTHIGLHPDGASIVFIKSSGANGRAVLVAVRASSFGELFVRSLFSLSSRKLELYIKSGRARPVR